MENKKDFQEKRFDSFLNKTIKYTSRRYFIKNARISTKEKTIIDNEDFMPYIERIMQGKSPFAIIDEIDTNIQIKTALNCLSDIEQAVIFLLFKEELSQSEAAQILEIYSKTVSKIKIRAITKLKKYLKGEIDNEK